MSTSNIPFPGRSAWIFVQYNTKDKHGEPSTLPTWNTIYYADYTVKDNGFLLGIIYPETSPEPSEIKRLLKLANNRMLYLCFPEDHLEQLQDIWDEYEYGLDITAFIPIGDQGQIDNILMA